MEMFFSDKFVWSFLWSSIGGFWMFFLCFRRFWTFFSFFWLFFGSAASVRSLLAGGKTGPREAKGKRRAKGKNTKELRSLSIELDFFFQEKGTFRKEKNCFGFLSLRHSVLSRCYR